jgi:preprotein translocase subunit SecG
MFTLFIVLHVIFCIFLILVILLQTGKGAGIGAAFGGGSQTVFGPRGAGSFIGRVTGIVAGLFMLTSITLAFLSTSRSDAAAKAVENALQTEKATSVENVALTDKKDKDASKKDATATPSPQKALETVGTDGQDKSTDDEKKAEEGKVDPTAANPLPAETAVPAPAGEAPAPAAPAPAPKAAPLPKKAAKPAAVSQPAAAAQPAAAVGAETPAAASAAPAPTAPAEPAAQ